MTEKMINQYNLDDTDRQILKLVVSFPGISQVKLAKELGTNRRSIGMRMEKPAFKKAIEDHFMTADELLKRGVTQGIKRLIRIINEGTPRDAIEATKVLAVIAQGRMSWGGKEHSAPPIDGVVFRTRIGQDGTINRSMEEQTKKIEGETIDVVAKNSQPSWIIEEDEDDKQMDRDSDSEPSF